MTVSGLDGSQQNVIAGSQMDMSQPGIDGSMIMQGVAVNSAMIPQPAISQAQSAANATERGIQINIQTQIFRSSYINLLMSFSVKSVHFLYCSLYNNCKFFCFLYLC